VNGDRREGVIKEREILKLHNNGGNGGGSPLYETTAQFVVGHWRGGEQKILQYPTIKKKVMLESTVWG